MAVGLEMNGQQRIWGGSAGRNSNTGEAQPWPAAKSTPASSVRGLGSTKRGTEGTRELGEEGGVALRSRRRPEGKAGARAPWPAAWSTPASADKGLRAMIQNGNWTGRKRRSRRAHHGRKSEAGMKRGRRTTVSSGRRTTAIPARRLLGHGRRKRERGEAAGGAGKGSAPFL